MSRLGNFNNRMTSWTHELIKAFYVRLAAHPIVNDPPVTDRMGNPVRITKFRNYDGIELSNTGDKQLTLSITPYSYVSADSGQALTSNSANASIVYGKTTLNQGMGAPQGPLSEAIASIVFKLHLFGYDMTTYEDYDAIKGQKTTFEWNESEAILFQWAEVLVTVLASEMSRLKSVDLPARDLTSAGWCNWVNFNTTRWTEDANMVAHTATILWQTRHYAKRSLATAEPIQVVGGYIGDIPDPDNPGETIPVWYDLVSDRYLNGLTLEPLPNSLVIDPQTGNPYSALHVSVIRILDMMDATRSSFVTVNDQQP